MSSVYRVDVTVTAPVRDTEVTDRVIDAVENLFPNADVEEGPGRVVGTTHSMEHFSDLLHEQAILDTAREAFFENRRGDTVTVRLKKQAAYAGVVNFAVGQPDELGVIEVEVRVHDPDVESFVDYVAPPTEGGVPVDERDDDGRSSDGRDDG